MLFALIKQVMTVLMWIPRGDKGTQQDNYIKNKVNVHFVHLFTITANINLDALVILNNG